jgi:catechol 2,3-dioxygenase-like lactoylglutathione lyase family enzyme
MAAPGALVAFVPSRDLERSAAFYRDVVGLELVELTEFACVLRSAATTVRVTLVQELTPHPFTVLGWDVADIRASLRLLVAAGAEPNRYQGMDQDEDGVWTAPSGTLVAWFHDPDGNVLSVEQHPG